MSYWVPGQSKSRGSNGVARHSVDVIGVMSEDGLVALLNVSRAMRSRGAKLTKA